MLDSVLVANEVVEELKGHERRGFCLKVDYEKAYDSVRWDFLVFTEVNGSPTEEFRPTRGLRQGDHIALFFFSYCCRRLG